MQNVYLFKKLTLNNFMLHKNSSFELDKTPITLLTGANGSGKTQVLDGLIIVLGHYPKRLKKSGYQTAIGAFSSSAEITLEIYLPQNVRQKMEVPLEIKNILENSEIFEIIASINNSGIDYYLCNSEKKHKVKRKIIRQLFKYLSIKAENKLAFTEEGTVNIFSDHSSRNKLDLFLQTTGLADYRDNIVQSIDSVEKAKRGIEPLRRKLVFERDYLNKMEESRHLMKKKQDLQTEYQKLVIEELWAKVQEKEQEFHIVEKQYNKESDKLEALKKNLDDANKQNYKIEKSLEKNTQQFKRLKTIVDQQQSLVQVLQGRNQSNNKNSKEIELKKDDLIKQLEKSMCEDSQKKLQDIKERMSQIEKERSKILEIKKIVGEKFFHTDLISDRQHLSHVIYLQQFFHEKKIQVLGPLFSEIKFSNLEYRNILWKMLGFFCFAFVTKDKKNFELARQALIDMKLKTSPVHIGLVSSTQKKLENTFAPYTKTSETIQTFLDYNLGLRIAEKNTDPQKTLNSDKLAQKIWAENQLLHNNNITSLGLYPSIIDLCEGLSIKEIQKALYANEIENKLSQEYQQLKTEYLEKSTQQQIQYIEERIAEVTLDLQNLQREIRSTDDEISQAEKKLATEQQNSQKLEQQIENQQREYTDLNKEIALLLAKKDSLRSNLNSLETQLQEKKEALNSVTIEAAQGGNRPEEIRSLEQVMKRRVLVEGKLSSIEITPISEEVYNSQVEKVEKLNTEVEGASEHIGNLQQDIHKRFDAWHTDVAHFLKSISSAMNYLLSNVVSEVRLRIENIKDPLNAGMFIEVKRHGKKWLDLSNLSGGEKVLTVEALILSMHLQTDSPIHAIDECTQRLDLKFKAMAFEMVQKAVQNLQEKTTNFYIPQFVLLAPDTLGIIFDEEANKYFHRVVLAPAVSTNN